MLKNKHGRSSAEPTQVRDAAEMAQARNSLADRLVEKWSRNPVGIKLENTYAKSKSRARNTALALENQERYLKNMAEATIKTQFQTVPENVLRIIRIGTANSNRGEIFTEWPLVTPDDAIYFVDRTYAAPEATASSQAFGALRGGVPGTRLYETIAPNFATESHVSATQIAGSASYTFTLTPNPVVPFSVKLIIGGALVGSDNGAQGFNSAYNQGGVTVNTTTSTINYTSGSVTINFSGGNVPSNFFVEYNWNSEIASNYDEYARVDLAVSKKRFNARPNILGYSYTRMAEMMLGTTGLGNVEDMLVRAVGDEHALRRDYKAVQFARREAIKNPISTFNADFAGVGEVSDKSNAQRILSTISDISGDLYNDIKRGSINRIVAGTKALTYFKKHDLWKTDSSQARVGGTYYAGTLDDIQVYAVPSDTANGLLAQNEALMVYKNPDEEGDVSIAFGVMTELVAALDYPEFTRVGNIATVEDALTINSKFIRMLQIQNLP